MLIELWLDQPTWLLVVLLAGFFGLTGLAIHGLALSRAVMPLGGVVAPFFGAISILFGLLTGFLASDAWERNRLANRAVLAERDALLALYDLSIATISDMSSIRAAVRAYTQTVIAEEWPRMRDGEASPKAAAALADLAKEVATPKLSAESGLVSHTALLDLTLRVRTARSDRLNLSAQYSDHAKWWTVLALAVLTQIALALVHLDKPRARAAAIGVFSLAAVVSLSLVAGRERPFDGALGLQPSALQEALAAMEATAPPPRSP